MSPVLAREVVELLAPAPGKLLLDGTLGGGGHSELFSKRGARVIGVDKDPRALAAAPARLARYGEAFRAVRADFRDAKNVLSALGPRRRRRGARRPGRLLAAARRPERGFSFRDAGPLDMRMGEEGETVAELLARVDERELARILHEYGEEPFARPGGAGHQARRRGRRGPRHRPARRDRGRRHPAQGLAAADPPGHPHLPGAPHRGERRAGALAAWLDGAARDPQPRAAAPRPSPSTRSRTGW